MAFGFGLGQFGFGARQGGGGVAAPLTAAQLRTDLAAFGFTVTRSGVKQSHILGSGLVGFESISANVATFERVTIGSRVHLGLTAFPASTPLVANSDNLTGWSTTGSPSVAYTASGGLPGAGYTTIEGNGVDPWTVSLALTSASANRTSRVRYGSVSGAVTLSQDGGSTTTAAAAGTFNDTSLPAQTAANPTLRVAGGASDSIIVYDFQHAEPASGVPAYKWHGIQGVTPAASGADAIVKTLGADLTDIDMVFVLQVPAFVAATNYLFSAHAVGTFTPGFDLSMTSSTEITAQTFGGTPGAVSVTVSEGELCKIAVKINGSECSITKNNGTPVTGSPRLAASGIDTARISNSWDATRQLLSPMLGIRDLNGNVFGSPGTEWNAPALSAFEATL